MRVTYKRFCRRFGKLLASKDTPPADDVVTSAKVRGKSGERGETVGGDENGSHELRRGARE